MKFITKTHCFLLLLSSLFILSCRDNSEEFFPVAKFSIIKIENEAVEFRNNSINATDYIWDFGDGNTSTEKDPTHIYSEVGTYEVVLTAKLGDKSNQTREIVSVISIYPEELTELDKPPFGSKVESVSFTWNGKGYVGFGTSNQQVDRSIWKFDPADQSWTQLKDAPKDFIRGVSFVINGIAYVGLGHSPWGDAAREFYKYDIASDSYTSIGLMPFDGSTSNSSWGDATAFVLQEKGYVIGHDANFQSSAKFMEFNPSDESWTEKSIYPGEGKSGMYSFVIDDFAYVGLGSRNAFTAFDVVQDFWKYDVINNTWTKLSDFPGEGRRDGIGFSRNGKGYISLGNQLDLNTGMTILHPDIWEYNVTTDSWEKIERMPLPISSHPYHFVLENKLFFGGGFGTVNNRLSDFYEYQF